MVDGDALPRDAMVAIVQAGSRNRIRDERHAIPRAAVRSPQARVMDVHAVGNQAWSMEVKPGFGGNVWGKTHQWRTWRGAEAGRCSQGYGSIKRSSS